MSVRAFIRDRCVSLFCFMLDHNHDLNRKSENNHSGEANTGKTVDTPYFYSYVTTSYHPFLT